MAETVECEDCHDLSEPTDVETINAACMDCHDDEEERFEGMLGSWQEELDRLLTEAADGADAEARRQIELLREAGPLHNMEATRKILRKIAGHAEGEPSP